MPRDDPISPALNDLLARFGSMVRRVGHRHDLAEADIDELMQDVRIRIWRALAQSEKIAGAPASYVYRTALSAAVDLIRRRRARREETLDADTGLHDGTAAVNARGIRPDDTLAEAEVLDAVTHAIETLSDTRRPVVRMYLAGYGRHEIAALLGWSEPKTRNLLYRGLADLRAELQRLGIGPEVMA